MLLVDHDEAQVLEGGEEGGAGADGQARAPAPQELPLLDALAGAERAVQDGQVVAEAAPQAREDLVGERDLRDQHQRLAARGEGLAHRAQVDLGLAAARHPVQQERLEARLGERVQHRRQGALLLGGELHRGRGLEGRAQDVPGRGSLHDPDEPAGGELAGEVGGRGEVLAQRPQRRSPLGGARDRAEQGRLPRRPRELREGPVEAGARGERHHPLGARARRRGRLHGAARDEPVLLQRAQEGRRRLAAAALQPGGAARAVGQGGEQLPGRTARGPRRQGLPAARGEGVPPAEAGGGARRERGGERDAQRTGRIGRRFA